MQESQTVVFGCNALYMVYLAPFAILSVWKVKLLYVAIVIAIIGVIKAVFIMD